MEKRNIFCNKQGHFLFLWSSFSSHLFSFHKEKRLLWCHRNPFFLWFFSLFYLSVSLFCSEKNVSLLTQNATHFYIVTLFSPFSFLPCFFYSERTNTQWKRWKTIIKKETGTVCYQRASFFFLSRGEREERKDQYKIETGTVLAKNLWHFSRTKTENVFFYKFYKTLNLEKKKS